MGVPSSLAILKANNNQFTGEVPSAMKNCSLLERLYLGGNKLHGTIPSWIGVEVSTLTLLQLRSNSLSGNLTHRLCNLHSLKILDLSQNRLSENEYFFTTLLLTLIDLSSNDLEGEIPDEISSLVQLSTLNLSMNRLSGDIPSKIGNLYRLETLDLSLNKLGGSIPQSLSNMTFLSHLNLSSNSLTGRIPTGNQLQALDDGSIYEGNPSLCGFPLSKCEEDKDNKPEANEDETNDHEEDDDQKLGLYISIVLGFIVGFWSVCGTLILKNSWRYAYFQYFDHIKEDVALKVARRRQGTEGGDLMTFICIYVVPY